MYFFCFQVDGPITGGAYKWGGGGAYNRDFTVFALYKHGGSRVLLQESVKMLLNTLWTYRFTF